MNCIALKKDQATQVESLARNAILVYEEIDLNRFNFPIRPTANLQGFPGYDIPLRTAKRRYAELWDAGFSLLGGSLPETFGWGGITEEIPDISEEDNDSRGKIARLLEIADEIKRVFEVEGRNCEGEDARIDIWRTYPAIEIDSSYLCFSKSEIVAIIEEFQRIADLRMEDYRIWLKNLGKNANLLQQVSRMYFFIPEVDLEAVKEEFREITSVRGILDNLTSFRSLGRECDDPPPPENNEDCEKVVAALEKLADNNAVADKLNEVQGVLNAVQLELNKIKRVIGVSEFYNGETFEGFQVPANIKKRSDGYRTIANIPDHTSWAFCQLESLIGNFPRKITVKDTEIDEQGNQEAEIELPNIAESLAEMYGLMLNTDSATDGCLNASMRILSEMMSTRQLSVKTHYEILSLVDFFGFAQKPLKKKLWLSADLSANRTEKFLEPRRVELITREYDESKEVLNFQDYLRLLATTYGIVASSNLHKVNPNESKELFEKIKGLNDKDDEDDFDLWTERAEAGFTDAPGISDPSTPYGRKHERRPRIKNVDPTGTEDIP